MAKPKVRTQPFRSPTETLDETDSANAQAVIAFDTTSTGSASGIESSVDTNNGNGTVTTTGPVEQESNGSPASKNGHSAEVAEKIKELVRLAQEQGYLTYGDINDALPETITGAEELGEIYLKLRNLEVEIVDQAEVDRIKPAGQEEEEEKARLDILDDPV